MPAAAAEARRPHSILGRFVAQLRRARIASERKVQPGQSVKIGLRPEHLSLTGNGSPLTGQTLLVEPTGAQTHVLFDLAGEQVTAVVDGEAPVRYGEQLKVTVNPDQVYVFDATSGLTL